MHRSSALLVLAIFIAVMGCRAQEPPASPHSDTDVFGDDFDAVFLVDALPEIRKQFPYIPETYFEAIRSDFLRMNIDTTSETEKADSEALEGDWNSLMFRVKLAEYSHLV